MAGERRWVEGALGACIRAGVLHRIVLASAAPRDSDKETLPGAAFDAMRGGGGAQADERAASDVVSDDKPASGQDSRAGRPQVPSTVASSSASTAHDATKGIRSRRPPRQPLCSRFRSSADSSSIRSRICLEGHTAVPVGEVKPEAPVA